MNWPTLCYVCTRPLSRNEITENPFCLFFTQESFVRMSQCAHFSSVFSFSCKQMDLLHIIRFWFTLSASPYQWSMMINWSRRRKNKITITEANMWRHRNGLRVMSLKAKSLRRPFIYSYCTATDRCIFCGHHLRLYSSLQCCLPFVARSIHHLFVLGFGSRNVRLQFPNTFIYLLLHSPEMQSYAQNVVDEYIRFSY